VYVSLDVIFLNKKNYMFRPVVVVIRFYHSTHLRLFYTIRVAACLMRRSQHLCSCRRYPACKARAPLNVVVCGPFGSSMFFHIISLNGTIFGIELLNTKCVF